MQVDEGDGEVEAEVVQLEQQIDMCNTQILDLQQKLIDADQGSSASLCLSVCLSTKVPLLLCVSVCLSVCLSTKVPLLFCVSVCLSVCQPRYLCFFVSLSVCLSTKVPLLLCVSVCLSVCV